jgi:25S rRNA (adenine2142-N1)-methyltransferase
MRSKVKRGIATNAVAKQPSKSGSKLTGNSDGSRDGGRDGGRGGTVTDSRKENGGENYAGKSSARAPMLAVTSLTGSVSKKRTKHSELIGEYHKLLKRIEQVDNDPLFPTLASKIARKRVLRAELNAAIGIDVYQAASRRGEAHGGGYDSSQWVLSELATRFKATQPIDLHVLDVGAIVHRFPKRNVPGAPHVSLNVKSIDLNPQDSSGRVEKADFFEYAQRQGSFNSRDVIVLSLVLNFVPSPEERGRMLQLAHSVSRDDGLLFIVLPRAVVENSRYCDKNTLRLLLEAVGWPVLGFTQTSGLAQFVCQKARTNRKSMEGVMSKAVLRTGRDRNNFTILLPSTSLYKKSNAKAKPTSTSAKRKKHVLPKARKVIEGKPRTSNERKRARLRAKHYACLSQPQELAE